MSISRKASDKATLKANPALELFAVGTTELSTNTHGDCSFCPLAGMNLVLTHWLYVATYPDGGIVNSRQPCWWNFLINRTDDYPAFGGLDTTGAGIVVSPVGS